LTDAPEGNLPNVESILRSRNVTTVALALVLLANLAYFMVPALAATYRVPARCASQVPLTAHSELLLGRHQQWLDTPPHFAEPGLSLWRLYPYRVVEMRTGLAYNWNLDKIDRGQEQLRFAVLTRWALLHPGWDSEQWMLLYDCPATLSAPPWPQRTLIDRA
jgi:hypothetical protein